MALTETNSIAEITVLPLENNVQVKWRNKIEQDGRVLVERDHYKLFGPDKYHDFLAEVEGAEAYIAVLGWTEPVPVEPEPESVEPEPEVVAPEPVEPTPETTEE